MLSPSPPPPPLVDRSSRKGGRGLERRRCRLLFCLDLRGRGGACAVFGGRRRLHCRRRIWEEGTEGGRGAPSPSAPLPFSPSHHYSWPRLAKSRADSLDGFRLLVVRGDGRRLLPLCRHRLHRLLACAEPLTAVGSSFRVRGSRRGRGRMRGGQRIRICVVGGCGESNI